MSEETEQQAVTATTDAPVPPGTEDAGAPEGDDLDTLLAEFETKTSEPPKPEPGADNETLSRLEAMEQRVADREYQADMTGVVKSVRGDMDPEFFDDQLVESWVDAEARKDPRLQKAWTGRHTDPAGFNKVVGQLSKRFAKKFGKLPDAQLTEDREAVTQAVRGASTKAPEGPAPDFTHMGNAEFNEKIRKEYGFDPGT